MFQAAQPFSTSDAARGRPSERSYSAFQKPAVDDHDDAAWSPVGERQLAELARVVAVLEPALALAFAGGGTSSSLPHARQKRTTGRARGAWVRRSMRMRGVRSRSVIGFSRNDPGGPAWSRRGASCPGSAAPCPPAGPRRASGRGRRRGRVPEDSRHPLARGPAVGELGAVLARGDGQHAVDEPGGEALEHALLQVRRHRPGGREVEGQLDPGVRGVDALTAGARRPREAFGQLGVRDGPGPRDDQVLRHGLGPVSRRRPAAWPSRRRAPGTAAP